MNTLAENIAAVHGEKGRLWLKALPEFIANKEASLNIRIVKAFQQLTYNYAALAKTSSGKNIVFKCGIPTPHLSHEIAALRHFNSNGAVKLLQANADEGWLLLEACQPGTTIRTLKDDDATRVAIQTMQALWRSTTKITYPFDHIKDWLNEIDNAAKQTSIIPTTFLTKAKSLRDELLSSLGEEILLHGDLHHDNILSAQRQPYLAIDPKGIIGEREYEIGALMRNPFPLTMDKGELQSLIHRRLAIITELTAFDPQRLLRWCFVQAILSACWFINDGISGADAMIHFAETIYPFIS